MKIENSLEYIDTLRSVLKPNLQKPAATLSEVIIKGVNNCNHEMNRTSWDKRFGPGVTEVTDFMATYRDRLVCRFCHREVIIATRALL